MSTLTSTRRSAWLLTVARVGFFAALIALSAKVSITLPGSPVPITLQTLAVLFTGLAIGPREGAAAVLAYLAAIASGLPVDTRGIGAAALVGPTAGYLLGFVPAAYIAGLAWRVADSPIWRKTLLAWAACAIATVVIYALGTLGLMPYSGSLNAAILAGVIPFIFVDFGKALLAVGLAHLGRESWLRWFAPR
jgi:biotin transport system substrate-specific component